MQDRMTVGQEGLYVPPNLLSAAQIPLICLHVWGHSGQQGRMKKQPEVKGQSEDRVGLWSWWQQRKKSEKG